MSKLPSSAYSGLTEKEMVEVSLEVYGSDLQDMLDLCEIGELDDETFQNLWSAIVINRDYILEYGSEKDKEKLLEKSIKPSDINFDLPEVIEEKPKEERKKEEHNAIGGVTFGSGPYWDYTDNMREIEWRQNYEGNWVDYTEPYQVDVNFVDSNFNRMDPPTFSEEQISTRDEIARRIREAFQIPNSYFILDEAEENSEEED